MERNILRSVTKITFDLVRILCIMTVVMTMPYIAYAENPVIYDASDFGYLRGRTAQDIKDKYTEAMSVGTSYVNDITDTYYEEGKKASVSSPYDPGVLTADTIETMSAMTNFYRWLVGSDPITVNSSSSRTLQAQALDRNFEFSHNIHDSSKPSDMDDETWKEGFNCTHNILSQGYTPSKTIMMWLNEGHIYNDTEFDTIGHRMTLLSPEMSDISYGYSGSVGIGKIVAEEGSFSNAFSCFPAAGYMPAEILRYKLASWSIELDPLVIRAPSQRMLASQLKTLIKVRSMSVIRKTEKQRSTERY